VRDFVNFACSVILKAITSALARGHDRGDGTAQIVRRDGFETDSERRERLRLLRKCSIDSKDEKGILDRA
jgi:hypothetical protein